MAIPNAKIMAPVMPSEVFSTFDPGLRVKKKKISIQWYTFTYMLLRLRKKKYRPLGQPGGQLMDRRTKKPLQSLAL